MLAELIGVVSVQVTAALGHVALLSSLQFVTEEVLLGAGFPLLS